PKSKIARPVKPLNLEPWGPPPQATRPSPPSPCVRRHGGLIRPRASWPTTAEGTSARILFRPRRRRFHAWHMDQVCVVVRQSKANVTKISFDQLLSIRHPTDHHGVRQPQDDPTRMAKTEAEMLAALEKPDEKKKSASLSDDCVRSAARHEETPPSAGTAALRHLRAHRRGAAEPSGAVPVDRITGVPVPARGAAHPRPWLSPEMV
ncbi:hypothetical protein ACHAWF_002916, partial [Thalassiosira exigua]